MGKCTQCFGCFEMTVTGTLEIFRQPLGIMGPYQQTVTESGGVMRSATLEIQHRSSISGKDKAVYNLEPGHCLARNMVPWGRPSWQQKDFTISGRLKQGSYYFKI